MAQRFCPECKADVEDTGGFCLLGHSLKLATAVPSMGELRAEVDKAFEDARAEVAQLLAAAPVPPGPVEGPVPPPGPVVEPQVVPVVPAQSEAGAEEPQETSHAVWESLSQDTARPLAYEDPIASFAPAPRMDWGPDRAKLRRRKDS